MKKYKTLPHQESGWAVKNEKGNWTYSVHGTVTEAWKETRRLACGSRGEATLKDKKGVVKTRNIYYNIDSIK